MVRFTALGAARQVTGSCYHLEAAGRRILVDCGLYQEREYRSRNWDPTPVDVTGLDAVLLTHAHLDHSGLLPKLVREGLRGPIWATPPTIDLAQLVIEDSARIQQEDAAGKERRHRKEGRKGPHPYQPLYDEEDARRAVSRMRPVGYDEAIELGPGLVARFHDAGHILGAGIVELTVGAGAEERRIVFSGDLGQPEVPTVEDPTPIERADYVVVESTYGDREHQRNREIEDQLAEAIEHAMAGGGNVVIPTFAIDRAQQLMLHLGELARSRRVPRVLAFLDSPMAVRATEIYQRHIDYMDRDTREAMQSGRLAEDWGWVELVRSVEQSKAINRIRGTCVILASSGMCTGGRIKHHLAWNIGRPESTILFAGYQAEGTLGREILEGAAEVRILGRRHAVKAGVRRIEGLSAHAGRSDLLGWLAGLEKPPRRVIVTHGEERAALAFADSIRQELGFEVSVPSYLDALVLD